MMGPDMTTASPIKPGEVRLAQLQSELENMQHTSEALMKIIRDLRIENLRLRARANRQRTELRRLNRVQRAMWEGVRFSHKTRVDMLIGEVAKAAARAEVKRPQYTISITDRQEKGGSE